MRLKDKVAVITGGGSGIGRAASILFSREGAKILLSDNKKDIGLDTVREIRESGGEASFAEADVSRPDQVTNMINSAKEAYGGVDILFNNAGVL